MAPIRVLVAGVSLYHGTSPLVLLCQEIDVLSQVHTFHQLGTNVDKILPYLTVVNNKNKTLFLLSLANFECDVVYHELLKIQQKNYRSTTD